MMHTITRAAVFGLIAAAALASDAAAETADRTPNIVVILADDLGIGDLSGYGAADMRTPAIDRLIAEGVRFTNAYANCPVCSPTRAALLSGRYPDQVGVPGVIRTHAIDSWGHLAPDAVLLPQMLARAGYHTAIVGKWHLGLEPQNHPIERGFHHFHGFLGDMMDDYYTHRRHGRNYMRLGGDAIEPKGHATDLFSDWAVEYIRGRADEAHPFFLYLAYNAPHTPIQPPDQWVAKVKQREAGITDRRAKLVALIEHMDHGIGRVMDALRASGEADRTLVIFVSDNGGQSDVGASNGPWRAGKGTMYEGGLRVPMAMVWPGEIKPGSSTEQQAMSMDIFATACAAAGVKIEHTIDGVNLLPAITAGAKPIERDLFWVRREGGQYMGQNIWAMRRGPWKLVQNHPEHAFELYNLADDPREERDVRGAARGQFDALSAALRAHVQRAGAVPWQSPKLTP